MQIDVFSFGVIDFLCVGFIAETCSRMVMTSPPHRVCLSMREAGFPLDSQSQSALV